MSGPSPGATDAGRTDTGVHAAGQVVHFETTSVRQLKAWVLGANTALKRKIAVHWAQQVPADFHARFSAYSRRYRYTICDDPIRPALLANFVTSHAQRLDADLMHAAGQYLLGELDFSAFRGASCQSNSPMRCVSELTVRRHGGLVVMDIEANAFLLHMVRNIMGCLVAVGQGLQPPGWMAEVLAARDRDAAAPTFAPDGLYFAGPYYDLALDVPERTPAFDWIP